MKLTKFFLYIFILQTLPYNSALAFKDKRPTLSRSELVKKYPSIEEGSKKKENKKVMCPFLRMLHRAGALTTVSIKNDIMVRIGELAKASQEFGCGIIACGSVAAGVSGGQLSHLKDARSGRAKARYVNLTNLPHGRGFAHDGCGLTFNKGEKEISDDRRNKTLSRLKSLADKKGRLKQEDLKKVKLETCKEDGVKISLPGRVEIGLIWSYLDGGEKGYVDYKDIARLLNAEMPKMKIKKLLF